MSEASAEFGISHSTIRKWDSEGKLFCARTPGGTRLVDRQSLLDCLGLGRWAGRKQENYLLRQDLYFEAKKRFGKTDTKGPGLRSREVPDRTHHLQ